MEYKAMRVYRIYTECKNIDGILKVLADSKIDGATIYPAMGVWKGQTEKAIVIEVVEKYAGVRVDLAAKAIKELNKQEAVIITRSECDFEVV